MHRLKVHRPCWVRRDCRCQLRHRLKVHRPLRVRRACRCPRRLKVHRPLRVRRACKCLQMHRLKVQVPAYAQAQGAQALTGASKGTGSRCTGPSGSGVLAGARKVHRSGVLTGASKAQAQGAQALPAQARRCPHTQSGCTGPSRSGVPAGARKCSRPSGPCCSTYHRGCYLFIVRRPRFSRCRRSSVPIAAQIVVGLVPGVPGSADAAGSHQVRSLLQHRPLWVLCQASRFSRCHRSSGPYCSMDHRGSIARRCRFNRVHVGLVPGVPGSVDVTGPQVPM